ncbi:peptide deformylase [Gluconacetobacter azotocaptans]|uniref:Peptide deformylase-like n=2 Tax=Gluconacetobacter azotocaptans TaxID=142834 RepID=A0A7W4JQH2_9PROT|nr:peptide deformylase [Gluconacetobacter azotocaptans]MBB2189049.1 peptide deformylase [Gluconacetobacter azotocaptans]MBM9402727.1 peptide deformylase [Gluconacetobacter azotocaptans]GBQ26979.1 N-formylmethionylaminoacyl-tRNA deformylase [Gluconacetobacter azotocaptans DSM 13594]
MTILPIVPYPDPRLHSAAAPVTAFDAALATLAADLLDTMRAAPGIGITAPHAGIGLRLVVIALPDAQVRTYVNPEIEWASPETARFEEGSVSMPGVSADIDRPARVRVRYHDLTGAARVEDADGLLAVCLQHEIDQLDGLFWTRRLSRLKRERVVKRFEKLRRAA